jgi:hypothetical protein
MIDCGTCGYPLTPEERTTLVEVNGKMRRPWKGLTSAERKTLWNLSVKPMHFAEMIEAKLKEKNA